MKLAMILLLALTMSAAAAEMPQDDLRKRDSLLVVSWNVENFFDWKDAGTGASDAEFTPVGAKHWTSRKFYAKCNGIAKVLLLIAERKGRLPDAVAFMEVENSYVMKQLLYSTLLRKLDYRIIHYDSPDHRGIDCALIYRSSTMKLLRSSAAHLYDSLGSILPTRDILMAEFEDMSILVNHHPSKVGSGGEWRRKAAMERMNGLCDSLRNSGRPRILCVGDFNDDVWMNGGEGTIKYNGSWEKIDGQFSRGMETVSEEVYSDPSLTVRDSAFGGIKPRRTYSGPRYLGGISDHFPVVVTVYY